MDFDYSGGWINRRAILSCRADESSVHRDADHRQYRQRAAGYSRHSDALLRRLPLQRNAVAVVLACRANILVRRRACGPRPPAYEFFHLGASGKRAEEFDRSAESDVRRSSVGRDAVDVIHADSLELEAFRGRCETDLRMVGSRTEAIGRDEIKCRTAEKIKSLNAEARRTQRDKEKEFLGSLKTSVMVRRMLRRDGCSPSPLAE
jgi:hypothetical protein